MAFRIQSPPGSTLRARRSTTAWAPSPALELLIRGGLVQPGGRAFRRKRCFCRETDDAVIEADAADTYVKPFDWALPAEPPVASEASGTADVTTPSEPDGQTDPTQEAFASQSGSFVATGYEEPASP